jgi:glutamine cyclotransferase
MGIRSLAHRLKLVMVGLPVAAIILTSCSSLPGTPTAPSPTGTKTPGIVPVYTGKVVHTYPHDRGAYTQGLVFDGGFLYEGTGLLGQSTLRRVELETGTVLKSRALSPQYFGEGVTICGDRIVQLTWRSQLGFVYDKNGFDLLREFTYPTEGWGITGDGRRLIMSDGSAKLYFLDPEDFKVTGSIEVQDGGQAVSGLNELEYIRGEIYANVWLTDRIVRIAPETGKVTGWIELAGLLPPEDRTEPVDVLNGIAYDAGNDRIFVTGKLWPKLFEIELVRLK